MIFQPNECALGFGYLADKDSRFAVVNDQRHPYCVQIHVDASVNYPKHRVGTSLNVQLPKHSYSNSPVQKISLPLWGLVEEYPGGAKHLQMHLDCERGTPIESLAELSARIHQTKATETEIELRDVLFQHLLAVAGRLHKEKRTIGLLDPGNVLYYIISDTSPVDSPKQKPSGPQIQLLLPDLLFNPSSGTPRWVESRQTYDFIWRPEYEKLNASVDDDDEAVTESRVLRRKYLDEQSNPETFDPAKDNRCLARLLAWSLTGKALTEPIRDIKLAGGVWDVIRDSLVARQPRTAEGVAKSLQEAGNEPAGHNGREPVVSDPNPDRKSATGWIFLSLLSLAGIAGAIYYFWPDPPEPPVIYELCQECTDTSPLHKLFTEKQLPLIKEYHLHYPYLENGDDLIFDFEVPKNQLEEIEVKSQEVFKEQITNLEKQMINIKSAISIKSLTNDEKECLSKELLRFQKALVQHFDVINPRLDSILSDEVKEDLASRFTKTAGNFTETVSQSGLSAELHPEVRELLANEVPKDYLDKYGRHSEIFNDHNQALAFLSMVRTYVPDSN